MFFLTSLWHQFPCSCIHPFFFPGRRISLMHLGGCIVNHNLWWFKNIGDYAAVGWGFFCLMEEILPTSNLNCESLTSRVCTSVDTSTLCVSDFLSLTLHVQMCNVHILFINSSILAPWRRRFGKAKDEYFMFTWGSTRGNVWGDIFLKHNWIFSKLQNVFV